MANRKKGAILFRQISSDILTPIAAFLKLSAVFPNYHFLLESAENSASKGRFSVIGLMPDIIWQSRGCESFICKNFQNQSNSKPEFTKQNGNPLENLRQLILSSKIDWQNSLYLNEELPAICCGIFGYMSYDMVRLMEKLPNHNLHDELKIADAIFIRPQILLVFDALYSQILICAPDFIMQEKNPSLRYDLLAEKIERIEEILNFESIKPKENIGAVSYNPYQSKTNSAKSGNEEAIGLFKRYCKADEFRKMVVKAKEYITAGDIFQVLPSQRFCADFPANLDEFWFYRSLRSLNPSPFLFFLRFDDFVLTGSSPEIMVSLRGCLQNNCFDLQANLAESQTKISEEYKNISQKFCDESQLKEPQSETNGFTKFSLKTGSRNRKITVRPLAGTRKRGKSEQEDKEIAADLLSDQKEIAEHLMLIDLGRNDVGIVSKPGSVVVSKQMAIEFYSHVMHISSTVEGELQDEKDELDALIAGFPAGTVSGAPKIRAMEIIEELESLKRSFYSGCVGYFSSNGDMETCITLRSALIKNQKIYLQSGAGVVFDSDPEFENQECLNKARVLMRAFELMIEELSER